MKNARHAKILEIIEEFEIGTQEGLIDKLAEYGISYDAACFRALILVLRDTESGDPLPISSHMHLKLLELAMRCAPQIRYVKMDGPDQMLFLSLLNDSEERTDQLHVSLSSLCWEINQAINCDVRIYIGNETESIEEIYYSFKLARELMVSSVSARFQSLSRPLSRIRLYERGRALSAPESRYGKRTGCLRPTA